MSTLLTENIKNVTRGVQPFVDVIADTNFNSKFAGNSWFWVGHFEADGHKLNFMYHISVLTILRNIPFYMINSVLSITDETKKIYCHEDRFFRAKSKQVGKGLSLNLEKDYVCGSLDDMHIKASMPDGSIDMQMHATGYPLYNVGGGYFQIIGAPNYQYSIPNLEASGTIILKNKSYSITKGTVWFDRQFANRPKGKSLKGGYNCHWMWMNLNFDNDKDKISLWGAIDDSSNAEYAWATVLHPDGSQETVEVEALSKGMSKYWKSPKTGQNYPTRFIVKIPSKNVILTVESIMMEQEIVARDPAGMKYEGASQLSGIYNGKEVTGYCCLELVGSWK